MRRRGVTHGTIERDRCGILNKVMHGLILSVLLASTAAAQQNGTEARAVLADGGRSVDASTALLRTDLERLIEGTPWRTDAWSVMVVSLDRGDTLFSHAGDAALAPASNVKLFTSAAALYFLGPEFRYNTFLLATGPVRDSVLEGDVVVYGTGDPTIAGRFGLATAVWDAFADTLMALGVRQIQGDLVGDASYFHGPGTGQGWQESYIDAAYAAPASALSYGENIATLRIRPAAQAGWRPEVTLVPGGDGIGLVNQATTVQRGATTIRVSRSSYGGPLVVQGQIPRSSAGVLRSVPVSDPARYAAAVFRERLESRGITLLGEVRSIERAEQSAVTGRSVFAPALEDGAQVRVLAVHNSPPLLEILEVINKRSHNLFAEQVLRTVGRVAVGVGSADAGVKAMYHMLEQEAHESSGSLQLVDGSGLSPLNRASARSFIHLLSFVEGSTMWPSFWATLPEAGARDGLRRMGRSAAERNLRAKTGTINHVSALSGYVRAANGEWLAFSILSNNVPSTWRAKRIEDAIGVRLASFTRPATTQVESAPPPAPPVVQAATAADTGTAERTGVAAPTRSDTAARATAEAPRTHRVARGETLEAIAGRYGFTVDAILEANPGLQPRRMQAGATIRLPAEAARRGAPNDATPAASGARAEYTIRAGDTLDGIARRHGTTVAALQSLNPRLNPRRLLPGTRIRIR
jgi:D-alanyl-D-alanine carboxypeptidase/D-alanyl-D-alanine-endopeptidase (penicillin-binding protein 4)